MQTFYICILFIGPSFLYGKLGTFPSIFSRRLRELCDQNEDLTSLKRRHGSFDLKNNCVLSVYVCTVSLPPPPPLFTTTLIMSQAQKIQRFFYDAITLDSKYRVCQAVTLMQSLMFIVYYLSILKYK